MATHNKQHPIDRAKEVHGERYDYSLFEYTTMSTKTLVVCKEHGPFSVAPKDHIYRKCGCPKCKYQYMTSTRSGTFRKWTTVDFIKKATEVHGSKYSYTSTVYVNAHTKLTISCPVHGEWWTTPSEHIRGNDGHGIGCPRCTSKVSAPERHIMSTLDAHNIAYKYQYKCDDLRSDKDRPLFYDFYLPDHNTIIEYDGAQHASEATLYGDNERRVLLDTIKNEYATAHGIRLIRIPHTVKKAKIAAYLMHRLNIA